VTVAVIRNWSALIAWAGVIAITIAVAIVARGEAARRRHLERGRRSYPCSHGAVGYHRWPADRPRP
jgi:hypothetical protein